MCVRCGCEKDRKMYMLVILFLLVLGADFVTLHLKKCCDGDSYLQKNHFPYVCTADYDKRVQILTNETNFLKNGADGTCIEIYPNITLYRIRNHTVVEEWEISGKFYPKCCPRGFFYHSVTHSCIWNDTVNEDFITQSFIHVGLPHCRLIVDYKLKFGRYTMHLGRLYINESVVFQEGQFCIDKDEESSLIARGCHADLLVCFAGTRCIHKCCPDGQSFIDGPLCMDTYAHGVDLSFSDRINNSQGSFAIIHGYNCTNYILTKASQFYLDTDGIFYLHSTTTNSLQRFEIKEESYCIEHILNNATNNFEFLMCFPDVGSKQNSLITMGIGVYLVISFIKWII